ncbi:anhydro-N-acetylmuramic acid kinase [Legionella micdadei]|uniref:Anhydro-N-acetylmuramic acid kinase n=1 Tax=Legionella micdadei TaxID=451 RepID=A0A098GEW8_LEGMI|nr:anhydro-N-acetylmuramic acid kinase [Legionella micdadei]ARG97493.1 anhydro-N-acetylmuramic acid kinase [Legionella micdadei]KTD28390.1 anhydro-N-acetylmuramic acid kinase [Legionella micdadei]NSL17017.1 anhydro-N-acetylmuramic acid kinase [Legionella micdadei]CEG61018.1 Anhydro-N-acetylmuramic acid kinase [Legionella micdadei]SCY70506.1 anhydro-N-acetylmuramic acid kinase [Legionella micdadei]
MNLTNKKLFIGLMSGTSMDGIDAALVDLSSNSYIAGITRPYSVEAKQYLNAVLNGEETSLKAYSQLNTLLGREFANAAIELLNKVQVPRNAIQAIGSHGQTLCHDATAKIPYTVQLGCPHTIAELTGITVIADFRTRDLVVGGQGAPFAPIYHQALFKGFNFPLAIVNVGGIANVTYLADEDTVRGYDLGPGNCLMDIWIKRNLGQEYDENGVWASTGKIIEPLLEKMLADPYFQREQPKSIGKEYFSLAWLESHLDPHYSINDVQATLLMLTATAIAQGIKMEAKAPCQLLICGGGAHNSALLAALGHLLPELKIHSTDSIHINPDFIEATMCAWLAEKTLNRIPLDLSQITGAKRSTILGAIYPGGIDKSN